MSEPYKGENLEWITNANAIELLRAQTEIRRMMHVAHTDGDDLARWLFHRAMPERLSRVRLVHQEEKD